jgi:hypothetical protein
MAQPLDTSSYSPHRPQIQKVAYTHDAMIDLMLATPGQPQSFYAEAFGYTQAWTSMIMASDAFQERMAQRKTEIVDPTLLASVEAHFKGLVFQAQEILQEKLSATRSADLALQVLEISTKALGYGARTGPTVQVNQQFLVSAPPKAGSSDAWEQAAPALVREAAEAL